MDRKLVIALFLLVLAAPGSGQGEEAKKELTLDLALRVVPLLPRSMTGVAFAADGKSLSWLEGTSGGPRWLRAPVDGGDTETLATEPGFGEAARRAGIAGLSLPAMAQATWEADGRARIDFAGKILSIDPKGPDFRTLLEYPADAEAHAAAPGDRAVAWSRDKDVYVRRPDGEIRRLSTGGNEFLTHGLAVSRVEFGIKDGLWWDPTGRRLAFYREDLRPIAAYPYVEWLETPARLRPGRYPMAGGSGSRVSIGIYDTQDDSLIWLDVDQEKDEYLTNVTWGLDAETLHVVHVSRSQSELELVAYDAASGKRKATLLDESDPQWIEPEHGPIFLKDGSGRFLWFSPRNGFNHIWLHAADGHLLQQVTHGAHDVSELVGFPRGYEKEFYYYATGKNPLERHLFRAGIRPTELKVEQKGEREVAIEEAKIEDQRITRGRGQHTITLGPDGRRMIDAWSALDQPPVVDLIDAQGNPVRNLHKAANPLAGYRAGEESFFTAKTDDGQDLHCHLILPPGMDRAKKHPVLIYVYAGPHSQFVRDEWMAGLGPTDLWLHYMATRGWVVLRTDGRGTINRGIEWAQAVHRRLGTLEVKDQIAALDHLTAQGFVDESRVAVHGWSFGGFMTLSLMTRAPERFRAGVSGAPVTDWRFYETGYGERYMDRPAENPEGYDMADPGRHVGDLKGRLLVVQGTGDETVVWQNTVDFIEKAIQAGKDVDYFIYPGRLHGLRGKDREHFFRKMTSFFLREVGEGPEKP